MDGERVDSVNRLSALALASLLGSVVAGVWAVCMITWTLPETDNAHGSVPFADPFVLAVFVPYVGVAWILMSAVAAVCLRRAPLTPSFAWSLGAALVTITVAAPFAGFLGALAAVPASLAVMVYLGRKYPRPAGA